MKIGSKRDLVRQLELAIEEIEMLREVNQRQAERIRGLWDLCPDLVEVNGPEIPLPVAVRNRIEELLLLLKDAEARVGHAETACKVKERVIVELKELRLDTSGRDRKIEHLERQLVDAARTRLLLEQSVDALNDRINRAVETLNG